MANDTVTFGVTFGTSASMGKPVKKKDNENENCPYTLAVDTDSKYYDTSLYIYSHTGILPCESFLVSLTDSFPIPCQK